jgi:hypothetical protein
VECAKPLVYLLQEARNLASSNISAIGGVELNAAGISVIGMMKPGMPPIKYNNGDIPVACCIHATKVVLPCRP